MDHEELNELAADAGLEDLPSGSAQHVVARLSAESRASAGSEVELSLDVSQVKLFDPDGGRSLTLGSNGNGAGARAATA
jgi:multiple sugar transport system ATP-binding protein